MKRHESTAVAGQAEGHDQGPAKGRIYCAPHLRSHYILKHPDKPALRVTAAYHSKELKRRTQESIIEQAGLTPEDFSSFL